MHAMNRRARPAQIKRRSSRAINDALALFQRRWAMRILWELRSSSLNFRKLQSACGALSASVLSLRISELRNALLVEHDAGTGSQLTEHGRSLMAAAVPLLRWAPAWAAAVKRLAAAGSHCSTRIRVSLRSLGLSYSELRA